MIKKINLPIISPVPTYSHLMPKSVFAGIGTVGVCKVLPSNTFAPVISYDITGPAKSEPPESTNLNVVTPIGLSILDDSTINKHLRPVIGKG